MSHILLLKNIVRFPQQRCCFLLLEISPSLWSAWPIHPTMNKQSSKESLRDKVKGIFGLGTPRPPSKQSDSKSSEFIITSDIIKVCRAKKNNPNKTNKKMLYYTHKQTPFLLRDVTCVGLVPGAPPRLRPEQPGPCVEPGLWACQNQKVWRGESWWRDVSDAVAHAVLYAY